MSAKRPRNNSGMSQTPDNPRVVRTMRDETSDEEDSYEDSSDSNEEEDDEENVTSSSKKVKFDAGAKAALKTPIPPMRRYIPDFGSLPNTGVWVSPAPKRHTDFIQVVVRTTKCDICNEKVGPEDEAKVMQRCRVCNIQFCDSCKYLVSQDERHFPVLSELVWDALHKPNATTRPGDNFKSNMYSKPKAEVIPTRPLTAGERIAAMRGLPAGTFNKIQVNAPLVTRPSRARQTKGGSKKNGKEKKKELPPGLNPDEVDAHYELDWEYIQQLPIEMQRKEKKEAAMRALGRKANLEAVERTDSDEQEAETAKKASRTPLPASGNRQGMSRSVGTPRVRHLPRGIAKSNKRTYQTMQEDDVTAAGDSDTITSEPLLNKSNERTHQVMREDEVTPAGDSGTITSAPLRNILDGLKKRQRLEQSTSINRKDVTRSEAQMQSNDEENLDNEKDQD